METCAENIIKFLPGVIANTIEMKSAIDLWSQWYFIVIVEDTNIYTGMSNFDLSNRTTKPTEIIELKALFGLLYISAMSKNNYVNAADLFITSYPIWQQNYSWGTIKVGLVGPLSVKIYEYWQNFVESVDFEFICSINRIDTASKYTP